MIPANLAFTSVAVGPGHHEIDLRYSPDGFRFALFLYFGVASGAAAFLIVTGLRGRCGKVHD